MRAYPLFTRILGFGASAFVAFFYHLDPGDGDMPTIWRVLGFIAIGFCFAIAMDAKGELDEDEEGPMRYRNYAWLPASLKMWDIGGALIATGCGLTIRGLSVSPHNYTGVALICTGIGLSLGIWVAYAWPPRPGA